MWNTPPWQLSFPALPRARGRKGERARKKRENEEGRNTEVPPHKHFSLVLHREPLHYSSVSRLSACLDLAVSRGCTVPSSPNAIQATLLRRHRRTSLRVAAAPRATLSFRSGFVFHFSGEAFSPLRLPCWPWRRLAVKDWTKKLGDVQQAE